MNPKIVIVIVAGAALLTGSALAQSTAMSPTGSGAIDPSGAYRSGRPASSNTGGFAVDTGSGSIPSETKMAGERG